MNVLFLSESPYPHHGGGAGKATHLLAAELARRGHVVRLLCEGGGGEAQPPQLVDGIEVHRVPPPPGHGIARRDREGVTASGLLRYLETGMPLSGIDLVHDSCGFMSFFFPLAQSLRGRHGLPVVTHFRYLLIQHFRAVSRRPESGDFLAIDRGAHETTQCFPVRTADRIICPSQGEARFVAEVYRPAAGTLAVLPDPVRSFDLPPAAVAAVRSRFARAEERLVLFGGRLDSDQKGGDVALRAFARLLAARPAGGPAVRIVLATEDGPAAERFRRELGGAVSCAGWVRDAAEMALLLAASDVVAAPSVYESFGLLAAEAMAAGTPVVASPVGAMPDLIRHGENGFLLGGDRGSWDRDLEHLLAVLLDDPERCRAMGQEARRGVRELLAVERVTDRLLELYREVLDRPRPGRAAMRQPRFTAADREGYLAALERRAGTEGRRAGEAVLAGWPQTLEQRCTACSRHRIASDTAALAGLARARRRRWLWLPPSRRGWRGQLEEVVARHCPLALLQRERLPGMPLSLPAADEPGEER